MIKAKRKEGKEEESNCSNYSLILRKNRAFMGIVCFLSSLKYVMMNICILSRRLKSRIKIRTRATVCREGRKDFKK